MRYRSKPSEVEAVQWTGDNLEEVESFGVKFRYRCGYDNPLRIKAGKGGVQDYVPVPEGHWVVKGGDPEHFWPVDPDTFAERYEPVEPKRERCGYVPPRNPDPPPGPPAPPKLPCVLEPGHDGAHNHWPFVA